MARNWDGTVTKKVKGALATSVTGTASRLTTLPAYNGFNGGGGGLVYAGHTGTQKNGWRIVGRSER